ncbi:MAG: Asp23/Gls24 family envelope stress response protein [Clostridia bacterium]|nr:Asp23/Gls24 family envelope stress response protein [Clostridia bacterium]
MTGKIENELGSINISDEVLANLAGIATTECYGIVGMAAKRATDGLVQLLGAENLSRGVKVKSENDEVLIDLFVIVEYGVSIQAVADNVIKKVKYTIENLTGMKVNTVNIHIESVRV